MSEASKFQGHSWPVMPEAWRLHWPTWCVSPERADGQDQVLVHAVLSLSKAHRLCPELPDVWRALDLTAPEEVQVVVLGQDPYHGPRQAHGLAFSVQDPLLPWPPSLRNMFQERSQDLDLPLDRPADLSDWAKQGVLLLNSALTTEAGEAGKHQHMGWEDAVVHALASLCAVRPRLVWVLWGKSAERVHLNVMNRLPDGRKHDVCLRSPHPSPLSAYRGFFGSRPFSRVNAALQSWGGAPILW